MMSVSIPWHHISCDNLWDSYFKFAVFVESEGAYIENGSVKSKNLDFDMNLPNSIESKNIDFWSTHHPQISEISSES